MGKTDRFKITLTTREKQLYKENVSIYSKTNYCDELLRITEMNTEF